MGPRILKSETDVNSSGGVIKWRDYYGGASDNIVGYDLNDFLVKWLRRNDHENLSMCEAILVEFEPESLETLCRAGVVFYSHKQLSDCHETTLDGIRNNVQKNDHVWLDYFSLRQCQLGDFNVRRHRYRGCRAHGGIANEKVP